jgi:DNA-binding LacI/PurR family transcriptional regulator
MVSASPVSNTPIGDHEARSDGSEVYAADIAATRVLTKANRPQRTVGAEELAHAGAEAAVLVHVSGVLVLPSAIDLAGGVAQRAKKLDIPVAIGTGDPDFASFDRVFCDHHVGAAMLVRWLISRSFSRIRFVSGIRQDAWWTHARLAGYNRAMSEAGLTPLPRIRARIEAPIMWDEGEFETAVRQMVGFLIEPLLGAHPAEAILATNDWEARLIARAARLLGRIPGRDIAIVGYDNSWDTHLRDWEPYAPCATIDQDWASHGDQLATLIDDRMAGRLPLQPQERCVKPRLVVNEAQATPPA